MNEIKDQKEDQVIEVFIGYANDFLNDNVDKLVNLGNKYALDTNDLDELKAELLKNNDFMGDFIEFYEGKTAQQQNKLYNRLMSGNGKKYTNGRAL